MHLSVIIKAQARPLHQDARMTRNDNLESDFNPLKLFFPQIISCISNKLFWLLNSIWHTIDLLQKLQTVYDEIHVEGQEVLVYITNL